MKSRKIDLSTKKKKVETEVKKDESISVADYSYAKTKTLNLRNKTKKKLNYKKPLYITLFLMTLVVLGLGALIYHYVYQPINRINNSVNTIEENAYLLLAEFSDKDLSSIDERFSNIQIEIEKINQETSKFEFLQNYNFTQGYYQNLTIGQEILRKTDLLIQETLPDLKNVLQISGFTVGIPENSEVVQIESNQTESDESEEPSAFNLVLEEMPLYLELYEEIEPDINAIFTDVKKLDKNYLPGVEEDDPEDKFNKLLSFIDEFPELSQKTKDILKYMPDLIGSNGTEARYLIILQNETEMRASGGLLTAYGHTTFRNGELDKIELEDMWNLQYTMWDLGVAMPRNNIYGQLYLMNMGCGGTEARAQDVAQYPDLYVTIQDFREYYDLASFYFPETYPAYDHIIVLNHNFAESLLELIQPLVIEGYGEVTADNLFEFIKNETDDAENEFDPERKSIIRDIANGAKEKFVDLPLSDLPKVAKTMIESFQAKDIVLGSTNPEIQAYLDAYELSGKMERDFDGDYLHFNEAQNCSLKLNKWLRTTVYQDIFIQDDGSINKSVRIKWDQTKVFEESISKMYDATLQFRYRAWVRLMTPPNSFNFDSDGYYKSGYAGYWPQEYYDEVMNKQVNDNIIMFDHRRFSDSDPVEKLDLNISYNLPGDVNYNEDGRYKLLIQKHPGKSWEDNEYEKYVINIHHKGKKYTTEFDLNRDKIINYKNGIITVDNYQRSLDWIVSFMERIPFDKLKNSEE